MGTQNYVCYWKFVTNYVCTYVCLCAWISDFYFVFLELLCFYNIVRCSTCLRFSTLSIFAYFVCVSILRIYFAGCREFVTHNDWNNRKENHVKATANNDKMKTKKTTDKIIFFGTFTKIVVVMKLSSPQVIHNHCEVLMKLCSPQVTSQSL